jgi:hypothetical protein
MAIVTYIDNRYNEREWKLSDSVAVRRTIGDYFAMPEKGDVLIIHGGQPEGILHSSNGKPLLIEAVINACGNGRAIIFSGGQPIAGTQTVREALANAGLEEGLHFLVLPAIQNLEYEIDFPKLLGATITSDWPIREVKRRYAAPTLLSLALLCQAAIFAIPPEEITDDAAALLGGRPRIAKARESRATTAKELLARHSWHAVFGRDGTGELLAAIEREWPPKAANPDSVRNLVYALYDSRDSLSGKTIVRAYCDLQRALALNQELQR